VSFAQEYSDAIALLKADYPPDFFVHLNVPFAVALGVLGTVQLISSLMILSFNRSSPAKLHYASAAGAMASFAAGTIVTTTVIYIN
jgi:hypothetical protein